MIRLALILALIGLFAFLIDRALVIERTAKAQTACVFTPDPAACLSHVSGSR